MGETTQEAEADVKDQAEMSSERKLEQQIMEQAKAIADQQLKTQAKSPAKISSAAAALNNAEMGLTTTEESTESNKNVMSISSDQIFFNGEDSPHEKAKNASNEAAAITVAKQAAMSYVKNHPESQVFSKDDKKKKDEQTAKDLKKVSAANVEIEQSAELDPATLQKLEKSEGLD